MYTKVSLVENHIIGKEQKKREETAQNAYKILDANIEKQTNTRTQFHIACKAI